MSDSQLKSMRVTGSVLFLALFFCFSTVLATDINLGMVAIDNNIPTVTLLDDSSSWLENQWQEAERSHESEDGFYIFHFKYNAMYCTVPAVMGAQAHYGAEITVYKIVDGHKTEWCSFPGTYTPNGCFEDAPDALLKACKGVRGEEINPWTNDPP